MIIQQVECIRKFYKGEPDIVIIDNSTVPEVISAINYYNNTLLNCMYYKTESAYKNGSDSHTFACNFAYNLLKQEYENFIFFDHDLFPIKEFSFEDVLSDKIMAGIGQEKSHKYFWPGCLFFNNSKIEPGLIDFSTNHDLVLDTGGNLYKVIEKYGEENFIFFNEAYHQNPYFNKSAYNWYSTINNGMFMHFVNASNWNPSEGQKERINSLLNILRETISK